MTSSENYLVQALQLKQMIRRFSPSLARVLDDVEALCGARAATYAGLVIAEVKFGEPRGMALPRRQYFVDKLRAQFPVALPLLELAMLELEMEYVTKPVIPLTDD